MTIILRMMLMMFREMNTFSIRWGIIQMRMAHHLQPYDDQPHIIIIISWNNNSRSRGGWCWIKRRRWRLRREEFSFWHILYSSRNIFFQHFYYATQDLIESFYILFFNKSYFSPFNYYSHVWLFEWVTRWLEATILFFLWIVDHHHHHP